MNEKPEALRLAENLVNQWWGMTASPSGLPEVSPVAVAALRVDAADELRRQHADNERLKAENERLRKALETMLTATTNDGKEQFPGHYYWFLEQVAKPRAKAALREDK